MYVCMCLLLKIVYPGASKILPVCSVLWEFLRPNQKNKRLSHLWNIYEYGWVLKFYAEIQPSGGLLFEPKHNESGWLSTHFMSTEGQFARELCVSI